MPVSTGPDSINLDYRLMTLVLVMASREDLSKSYTEAADSRADEVRWKQLLDLGFPIEMLRENLYVFQNRDTQDGLAKVQRATQTIINLNDYCPINCPGNNGLTRLIGAAQGITQPVGAPGAKTV